MFILLAEEKFPISYTFILHILRLGRIQTVTLVIHFLKFWPFTVAITFLLGAAIVRRAFYALFPQSILFLDRHRDQLKYTPFLQMAVRNVQAWTSFSQKKTLLWVKQYKPLYTSHFGNQHRNKSTHTPKRRDGPTTHEAQFRQNKISMMIHWLTNVYKVILVTIILEKAPFIYQLQLIKLIWCLKIIINHQDMN